MVRTAYPTPEFTAILIAQVGCAVRTKSEVISTTGENLMNRQDLAKLSEEYIKQLLKKHLPESSRVYLFGSRARQDGRWNSDYDLWIDAPISRYLIMEINDALEESFVPFEVDLVTTDQLKGRFGEQVKKDAVRWM